PRGPSSLSWAILTAASRWGLTMVRVEPAIRPEELRSAGEALVRIEGLGSRLRYWGKHGRGCRQGPVLGAVQGAGAGDLGIARWPQQGPGEGGQRAGWWGGGGG